MIDHFSAEADFVVTPSDTARNLALTSADAFPEVFATSRMIALMELAAGLARRDRIAVLFTEHDMEVVFGFASRVIVMHLGEVIASGSPEEVRSDARVREVYLGDT